MKKGTKTLTRSDLLTADAVVFEAVELEKGLIVHVREMSGQGKDIYERSILKKVKRGNTEVYETTLENFKAKLCVATVCDETGSLLFRPTDAETLAKSMSARKIEKIVEVAQRLNMMDEASQEDTLKN